MRGFHYNYTNNKHSDKTEMSLKDTDSLMYTVEAKNVCEDFYKDKEFSNYPKNLKFTLIQITQS